MAKTKVLVAVFTGHERHTWIYPGLAVHLIELARSQDYDVAVTCIHGRVPVCHARNHCVTVARDEFKADWLLMVDNDQDFRRNPLEVLAIAEDRRVIAFPTAFNPEVNLDGTQPTGLANPFRIVADFAANPESTHDFLEVRHAGSGAMFIHREVWETIPRPWFKRVLKDDELTDREPHAIELGEDYYFCDRAREAGFKVWFARQHPLLHYKTNEQYGLFSQFAQMEALGRRVGGGTR